MGIYFKSRYFTSEGKPLYISCLIILNIIIFLCTTMNVKKIAFGNKEHTTVKKMGVWTNMFIITSYVRFRTFQTEYSRLSYFWHVIEHLEYS